VVAPYLSGLKTIIEWSQYHIGFSIKEWSKYHIEGVILERFSIVQ